LTPFEIDSTPVSAAEPDANARRRTRTVTAPMPAVSGCGTVACGQPLVAHLTIPAPITAYSETTKPYVGSGEGNPASRPPRRFATVSARMQPRHSQTRYGSSEGAAEVIARIPAATETATVRM